MRFKVSHGFITVVYLIFSMFITTYVNTIATIFAPLKFVHFYFRKQIFYGLKFCCKLHAYF